MPGLDDAHTGTRIANQRKLAGLTQRGLASRLPYSYSLLRQVEEGHKNASPDFVSAVSRVLRIDVTVLTGQPYVTELQQDRLAELIRPIRECLDLYDLGFDPTLTVRPLSQLTTAVDELCHRVRASQLHTAAREISPLIAELTAAAHQSPSTEAWRALGSAYRTAHDIATKLGFYDLSTIALDRMGWAAERASDSLLAAVRQYMRALVYFREGEQTIGLRLIRAGQECMANEGTREALVVAGQLHLGATVISARAHDKTAVQSHLAEARAYAQRTGEAGRVHWLSFGPANVAAHEVSADVEMRQYGAALKKTRTLEIPTDWATSRRTHFHIDRARAEMETGDTNAALESLARARELAPQQTRYHPGARETIKGLVHQRRRTPESLDSMARWIGL